MKHTFRQLTALFLVICMMMGILYLDTGIAWAAGTAVSVTIYVGETAIIVDESGNYEDDCDTTGLDSGTAAVDVSGSGGETVSTTTYTTTQVTSATSGSAYYVGNGSSYLVFDGSTLSTTADISAATAFTWSYGGQQGPNYYYYLYATVSGTNYYLYYSSGWSVVTAQNNATKLTPNNGSLTIDNGPGNTTTTGYYLYTYEETTSYVTTSSSTTVTITGVAEGTTSVTVGDTLYNITVLAARASLTTSTSPFLSGTGVGSGSAVTKLTISETLTYDLDLSSTVLNSTNTNSYTVYWSSADESIATVDQDGIVTGVSEGTTNITATITYSDGTVVSYTIPVEVRDYDVDYTASLKYYDFYIEEVTNTTAYYGILYGAYGSYVTAYGLYTVQDGEAIYLAFEQSSNTAVDFFARPDDGYALTHMSSTNSNDHYNALDSDDPASTTFITTSSTAGHNQANNSDYNDETGNPSVYTLVQLALYAECDAGMGWTRPSGSTSTVSSTLCFRSQQLPTVAKEITSVNDEPYEEGATVEVNDVITYTITVTQPPVMRSHITVHT